MNPPVPVKEDSTNTPQTRSRVKKSMSPVNADGNLGWTLFDNNRKKVSDYKGKVVILDFWATYCPPCVEGTPHLVQLQNQYGKDGLVVVGLNVGGDEDAPKIADFIKQFNVQYDIAVPDAGLVQLYMADDDRIPQTIVLNRQGQMIQHFLGFNKEIGAELEETVKKAVKE